MTVYKRINALFIECVDIELIDNQLIGSFIVKKEGDNLHFTQVAEEGWTWVDEPVYIKNSAINHIFVSVGNLTIKPNDILADIVQLTASNGAKIEMIEDEKKFRLLSVLSTTNSFVRIKGAVVDFFSIKTKTGGDVKYDLICLRCNIENDLSARQILNQS